MSKFKIGDKVRLINDERYSITKKGDTGTVVMFSEDVPDSYKDDTRVKFDGLINATYYMWSDDLELIETKNSKIQLTRKDMPVFSGVLQYFPDAIMEVALHSKRGNDKHNPGQPLHWARDKSTDHPDCIARHLIDIGPNWDALDPETGSYHAAALAWRALALLQLVLERSKKDVSTKKE